MTSEAQNYKLSSSNATFIYLPFDKTGRMPQMSNHSMSVQPFSQLPLDVYFPLDGAAGGALSSQVAFKLKRGSQAKESFTRLILKHNFALRFTALSTSLGPLKLQEPYF